MNFGTCKYVTKKGNQCYIGGVKLKMFHIPFR